MIRIPNHSPPSNQRLRNDSFELKNPNQRLANPILFSTGTTESRMTQHQRTALGGLDCIEVWSGKKSALPPSLAVFCHGFGAPGTDLVPLADELIAAARGGLDAMRFVFPAAPLEVEPDYDGRCWWPINLQRMQMAMAMGRLEDLADVVPDELPDARERILQIVSEVCQRDGIAASQVLLGGFSQGAMLAADVALHLQGELGGLLLWSGMMINQSEWRPLAASSRPIRVVQSHGTLDPVLPYHLGERLKKVLEQAGHQVEFVSFEGYHQIPGEALLASLKLALKVASGG